jgi:hypothetical protein
VAEAIWCQTRGLVFLIDRRATVDAETHCRLLFPLAWSEFTRSTFLGVYHGALVHATDCLANVGITFVLCAPTQFSIDHENLMEGLRQ